MSNNMPLITKMHNAVQRHSIDIAHRYYRSVIFRWFARIVLVYFCFIIAVVLTMLLFAGYYDSMSFLCIYVAVYSYYMLKGVFIGELALWLGWQPPSTFRF